MKISPAHLPLSPVDPVHRIVATCFAACEYKKTDKTIFTCIARRQGSMIYDYQYTPVRDRLYALYLPTFFSHYISIKLKLKSGTRPYPLSIFC